MKFKKKIFKYLPFFILLSLILFPSLPYGSVQGWSRNLAYILCLFLFILVITTHNYKGLVNTKDYKYEKILLLLFVLIVLLQITPLPPGLLGILGSENLNIWESNRIVLEALGMEYDTQFYTISLYPHITWNSLIELFAYFVFGYSASRICNSANRMRLILAAIFLVAMLQSITGIIQFFNSEQGFASGTYINKNHYAGFLELSVFILIGYVISMKSIQDGSKENVKGFAGYLADDNFVKQLAFIFVLSITTVALFLSFSRMGIISFLIALTFMYILYKRISRHQDTGNILIILFIIIGLAYVVILGFHPLINRFLDIGSGSAARFHVWRDSVYIISDYPIFGTGLGTFKYIYPIYKTIGKAVNFNFAHNDFIQLMVETGISGFVFLLTPLILFLRKSMIKLNNLSLKEDQFSYLIKLGALSSIISILIHSLADFNLHIPANALFFSLMLGIVIADFRKENDV